MKIHTTINQYTADQVTQESKRLIEKNIFPTGPITVPVMFEDIPMSDAGFFTVADGKIAMNNSDQKIDFGFKFYSKNDGPDAIPEMLDELNGFFHDLNRANLYNAEYHQSLFLCIDKILFDLGYVGKMVKAEGIEKNEKGELSIYSSNYAENLITKEDWVYQEYLLVKKASV